MARTDDALATLILTSRLSSSEAQPLTPSEFWSVMARTDSSPSTLPKDTTLDTNQRARIESLWESGTALAVTLESLANQGIHTLTPFDDEYPSRFSEILGSAAPPVIFVAGDRNNLHREGLGIVGSREIPDAAIPVVRDAAEMAAQRDMPLISGGARGIDQLAMAISFQRGGTVIGVLADSLLKRIKDPDTRRAILDGTVTLITQQKPDLGFTVGGAMGRNKLIYALSRMTFVVASDLEKGGTWAGATEALRKAYGVVAVWAGEGKGTGNDELIRRGGRPISDVTELLELDPRRDTDSPRSPTTAQLDMGF